jgi:H+-transporting ATPase
VLAAVACISSLLLLWMAADSIRDYPNSWFHGLGISQVKPGQIVTMLYLKVSISDFLTLFSARTQQDFFWTYAPSRVLLIGAVLSLTISTLVGAFWPDGSPDDITTIGLAHGDGNTHFLPIWVWLYCIFWWFLQDVAKVLSFKVLDHFDMFQYRTIALGHWSPQAKTSSKSPKGAQEPLLREGKGYGSVN